MRKTISEEFVPAIGEGVNQLQLTVSYSPDTVNMLTCKPQSRGYYLTVKPVEVVEDGGYRSVSFTMFTGTRWLLLACDRQSKLREKRAIEIAAEMRNEAINHVLMDQGLQLAG